MSVVCSAVTQAKPDVDSSLLKKVFQPADKGTNWMDARFVLAFNCATLNSLDTSLEGKLFLKKMGKFDKVANIGIVQAVES